MEEEDSEEGEEIDEGELRMKEKQLKKEAVGTN